ncbi:hypothetical protein AX17_006331 [Amanita inopinata Kibby_2008]|nr:hypothetical protein AX17_006331 [Amanita inopinata Kibby_2008]
MAIAQFMVNLLFGPEPTTSRAYIPLPAISRQVMNAEDFETLDALIEELAEDGVEVQFWKVAREDNSAADALAKDACA